MGYASRLGHARINPSSPEAAGTCDRCGFVYSFSDLRWQFQWAGAMLQNIRILVCYHCEDEPQEQLRAIVLPPDPVPVINARPFNYRAAETDYQTITQPPTIDPVTGIPISGTTTLVTQDGQDLTTEPYGRPVGLEQYGTSPLNGTTHYGVKLVPLSLIANGTATVTATFASPHGLNTNDQISVEGLSNSLATGFYSVTVTSATAFTYETYSNIAAGSLLTPTTLMWTALVGLPYGYDTIQQVGP